jgi:hypothetical protein
MFLKSLGIALIGLFVLAFNARGGPPTLEGVVKDSSGRPIKGADIWVQAKDFSKVVKTDASGHYISDGFVAGSYKVTLVVDGSIKASILNAETRLGESTQLNFDLTQKTAPVNTHTHMIWVPGETGTHIGTGRWVNVDDNNKPLNIITANNVVRNGRTPLDSDKNNRIATGCSCLGGGLFVGLGGGRSVSSLQASKPGQ